MKTEGRLVWIDLEMSGLDLRKCEILEIATIITDSQLEIIAEGPEMVIHQSDEVLDAMDEWNTKHHGASGLTKAVRNSDISLEAAEEKTLRFVRRYCEENNAPLCGNSIWQDRRFLARYMPELEQYLSYRVIDVSSFKEVVYRWYSGNIRPPSKGQSHRALDDIQESIKELKFYREHVFAAPGGGAETRSADS